MSLLRSPEHSLDPDERRVMKIRHHWASIVDVLAGVPVAIVGLALLSSMISPDYWLIQSVLWYAMVAALVWYAWRLLHWYHNVVVITDSRMMRVSGVLTTTAETVPVSKVTDYTLKEPLIGKVLGYATFVIESAGKESLKLLTFIPHPDAVESVISKLVLGKELPPHRTRRKVTGHEKGLETIEDHSREWPTR